MVLVVEVSVKKESIFPISMQFSIRFLDGYGEPLREIPFRYTVKHARHWGLLKKSYLHNGTRQLSTPTNAHFDDYAGVMANIALNYLENNFWVLVRVVGPNLVDEHRQECLYGGRDLPLRLLDSLVDQYEKGAFYVIKGFMRNVLRHSVVMFANTYLDKAGYRPQKRPRKYLHKNYKVWRNYKGLAEATVKRTADIIIDRAYDGSLLDIKILPEVLKYANNRFVFWTVNTAEQALEAQLLHPNGRILVRASESEGRKDCVPVHTQI